MVQVAEYMTQPIPVAVVGAGYFGRLHAKQYAANPAAKLVAIVDIDEARARAVADEFGAEAACDTRSLIGRVAGASVAVPTAQHFEVARQLIDSGIHVLVEKPLTDNLRCVAQHAPHSGVRIVVGFQRTCVRQHILIKEVIHGFEPVAGD